jgi:exonuclease III
MDIIGLTEIIKIHTNGNYDIEGYQPIDYRTREDGNDRGGVAMYIKNKIDYKVCNDLSVFIPHIFESLFIELKTNNSDCVILGTIYIPNTAPKADLDIFLSTLLDLIGKTHKNGKRSY